MNRIRIVPGASGRVGALRGEHAHAVASAVVALSLTLVAGCTPAGSGRVSAPPGSIPTPSLPATPEAGATGGASMPPAGGIPARLSLETVASGFDRPLFATGDGTGSGRLYVAEQGGTVRVVEPDGSVAPTPFLDLSSRISAGGERGLLGLAFHPSYASNGLLYVDYTDRDGNTVVSEMRRTNGSPERADPSTERLLLRIDQPYPNHNGGMLAFGPDGDLYVGMGDGGSGGDPENRAQDLGTLLGKILRIDVAPDADGRPYTVPASNPFVGKAGARPEIWAYGVRNPWRFSFDAKTGDLWIGDVGQSTWEEVDRLAVASGGGAGADLGWRIMEGRACFDPPTGCATAGLTLPVAVYGHDVGCAVTGGYVYRGARSPTIDGIYLFADSCSGRIWGLDAAGPDAQEPALLAETGRAIASFGQGDDGELYVTDIADGSLLRIDAGAG